MAEENEYYDANDGSKVCSSTVSYKDRDGQCQRLGKYPDPDGVRWWCGLHNPDRRAKARPIQEQEDAGPVATRDVLLGIKDDESKELLEAMNNVHKVLIELSNTNIANWPDTTPVEKYKIILTHMADRAREASHTLGEKILQFRS